MHCHLIFSAMLIALCKASIPKIAIVGGGIGGASTAYWLRDLFEENQVEIHLYEGHKLGGRIATLELANREFEAGGAVLHPSNRYMKEFMKLSGLKDRDAASTYYGIFNGRDYPFKESYYDFVTIFRLFWRYGNDILNLKSLINEILDKFVRIYEIQSSRYAFTKVETLLAAMSLDFPNMTRQSISSFLQSRHFGDRLINELAAAVMNVNYGQTTDINAFVGSVSLAGAMPGLFSVKGGNKRIVEDIIIRSGAMLINNSVTEIQLNQDETFNIFSTNQISILNETYNMVVVAVPLVDGVSNIAFTRFPTKIGQNEREEIERYEKIFATFVHGELNLINLGLTESDVVQELLVNNRKLFFNSVGRCYPVDYETKEGEAGPKVYKVFSGKPLSDAELGSIFSRVDEKKVVDWWAYPHYTLPEQLDSFILHKNLFYTSAIERAASAMEMSAIAGKNAALLAFHSWRNVSNKVDFVGAFSVKDEL